MVHIDRQYSGRLVIACEASRQFKRESRFPDSTFKIYYTYSLCHITPSNFNVINICR